MLNKLFYFTIVLTFIAFSNTDSLHLRQVYAENTQVKDIPQRTPEQNPNEKVLQQYITKLKENPNDIETHRAYQNLMRELGRKEKVQKEYSAKLQAEPQNPLYHYLYGRLLDGKELEDAFKKAIELETKSPNQELRFWIYFGMGQFYKDTKKYKEALQNLETAQKLKPDFLDVQHQIALVYYDMDNIIRALDIWDRILKINPNYNDARLGKALNFKAKGDYDNAIKELENILKIDETYWKAYEPLIQCYHVKQDYKKGEELRIKIKELYQKTTDNDFKKQESIVIDILHLKRGIIVVKEWINLYHLLSEEQSAYMVTYTDYSFEIYREGIDKKPGIVYTLYRVYKVPDISLDVVRLVKVEVTDKDINPKRSSVKEYKTMPPYLELLTLIMNREKDK